MDAYAKALSNAVRPGAVVLDIGTGIGMFALLACEFGARQVYAIETSDAIQTARQIALANGCAERIQFLQESSLNVRLPERADVIVSDLRGCCPLFQRHIQSIADARARLLAPGGVLIPRVDTLWCAVVDVPEMYRKHVEPWEENTYGFDMGAARALLTNDWEQGRKIGPSQVVLDPQCWAALDYRSIETPNVEGEASWTVTQAGTGHGLLVWFDAELAEGVGFSNAPSSPDILYGSMFLPWTAPVALEDGDAVGVKLNADLLGEDYTWRWQLRVTRDGCPAHVKADYKQSTFAGRPVSTSKLSRREPDYVPSLNDAGLIDRRGLELMDGNHTLRDIARQLTRQFPEVFETEQQALARVRTMSTRYSR